MSKHLALGLVLAAGLSVAALPAHAIQASVTAVDTNADGTKTYHFTVTLDAGDSMAAGAGTSGDFLTLYNFYGLVDGSVKSPEGWTYSSEEFGRTPTLNGYPLVLPVDVPNTPNLTWTVSKAVVAGKPIEGFSATTKSNTVTEGEYTAMVTRQAPATKGMPADAPTLTSSKQAVIGFLPMPAFLAPVK